MIDRRRLWNYRLPLGIGAGLIVLLIVATVLQTAALHGRRARLNALLAQSHQLEQQVASLPAVDAEVANMRQQWNHAGADGSLAMGALLQRLGQDMAATGAHDRQIETGTATRVLQWRCLPITISFRSNFLTVQEFLQRVEAYPVAIRPERISLTRDDPLGQPQGPLQVTINLDALTPASGQEAH